MEANVELFASRFRTCRLHPSMEWNEENSENEIKLQSFQKFVDFPFKGADGIGEFNDLYCSKEFNDYCLGVICNLRNLCYEQTADFLALAISLRKNPELIYSVNDDSDTTKIVWCLGQCLECDKGVDFVIKYIHENLLHPIKLEFEYCNSMLLIIIMK